MDRTAVVLVEHGLLELSGALSIALGFLLLRSLVPIWLGFDRTLAPPSIAAARKQTDRQPPPTQNDADQEDAGYSTAYQAYLREHRRISRSAEEHLTGVQYQIQVRSSVGILLMLFGFVVLPVGCYLPKSHTMFATAKPRSATEQEEQKASTTTIVPPISIALTAAPAAPLAASASDSVPNAVPRLPRNPSPAASAAQTFAGTPGAANAPMPDEAQMSDSDRRRVQAALALRGYCNCRVDGQLGRETRAAISLFQKQIGVAPTEQLSAEQAQRLIAPAG